MLFFSVESINYGMKNFFLKLFKVLLIFLVFILGRAVGSYTKSDPKVPAIQETYDNVTIEDGLFNLANESRKPDISPLIRNFCLNEQALIFAQHIDETGEYTDETRGMIVFNCFDITDKGKSNKLQANGNSHYIIHSVLMTTKWSRDAILSDEYTDVGIGCYGEKHICVELFYGKK